MWKSIKEITNILRSKFEGNYFTWPTCWGDEVDQCFKRYLLVQVLDLFYILLYILVLRNTGLVICGDIIIHILLTSCKTKH